MSLRELAAAIALGRTLSPPDGDYAGMFRWIVEPDYRPLHRRNLIRSTNHATLLNQRNGDQLHLPPMTFDGTSDGILGALALRTLHAAGVGSNSPDEPGPWLLLPAGHAHDYLVRRHATIWRRSGATDPVTPAEANWYWRGVATWGGLDPDAAAAGHWMLQAVNDDFWHQKDLGWGATA